jgi:alanyl-tRNA synthetase
VNRLPRPGLSGKPIRMTRRLYWDDSLLLSFDERTAAHARVGERPALVLEATAFYPEAGGQLADTGRVAWEGGGAAIVDAQEDAAGRVLHVLDLPENAALPELGAPLRITIDEARRRAHMSQHTGQHMLSRALLDRANAPTASSRLGDSVCTIDLSIERLSDEALADVEALVAGVVLEDRPVRQLRPTAEELAKLPLRREPKVTSNVRIIDVDGFDLSPCGGTHVVRTGQVGALRITGVERHKGGLRISFLTGLSALADASAKERVLTGLARELTCGWPELPGAIEKLRGDAKEHARSAEKLRTRLAGELAKGLLATATGVGSARLVVAPLGDESPELARSLATALGAAPDVIAFVWTSGAEGTSLVVQRGDAATSFDAGAAFKRVAAACGGRGGGRPNRAEGKLPAGADVAGAVELERQRLAG